MMMCARLAGPTCAGVALADLIDGELLLGHADGEPVGGEARRAGLLVRLHAHGGR
jgi:hypothetical protein